MEIRIELDTNRAERHALLKRALILEIVTVAWNVGEGLIAVGAGIMAHSVALIGFGVDSLIETASALIVGWRLREELKGGTTEKIETAERKAAQIAGVLLLLLAVYVAIDACFRLLGAGEHPDKSFLGIGLTIFALAVMLVLAQMKLKIADAIKSKALRADAMETTCCAWMAFTTLCGLLLNMVFGWWWADAVAGLILVPLLMREGIEALKGEDCGCHSKCD